MRGDSIWDKIHTIDERENCLQVLHRTWSSFSVSMDGEGKSRHSTWRFWVFLKFSMGWEGEEGGRIKARGWVAVDADGLLTFSWWDTFALALFKNRLFLEHLKFEIC